MEYLVCQFRDEPHLVFITTRKARETMLNVLLDLGQEVESFVLKSFKTYDEADKYKKGIIQANQIIDRIKPDKNK